MKTKLFLSSIVVYILTACTPPSVDVVQWEERIFPQMRDQRAFAMAIETIDQYDIDSNTLYYDRNKHENTLEAMSYVIDYIADSLSSYCDVRYIYDILSAKEKEDKLFIKQNNTIDNTIKEGEETLQLLFANAFFGSNVSSFKKTYILNFAKYIQEQMQNTIITMDTPQYVSQTKDRIMYSVYCPSLNETYTLSYDKKNETYHWDLHIE